MCATGDEQSDSCGVSDVGECRLGARTDTCNNSCQWVAGECRGAINPTTEVCGSMIDSDCNGDFFENPDVYEPNNTCASCFILDPEPDQLRITALIDSTTDSWDYFCFESTDSSWNPIETVEARLENLPMGLDYDLFLYKSVSDCQNDNYLGSSNQSGDSDEFISWREDAGSDDTSTYIVGVKSYSNNHSCNDSYILTISGL